MRHSFKNLPPDQLPAELYEKPYFVLLESSLGGRYTMAAWEPRIVLKAEGDDFFRKFREQFQKTQSMGKGLWIGYLGYELYSEIEPLSSKVPLRTTALLPKAVFCFYDDFYIYDHSQNVVEPRATKPSSIGRAPSIESNFTRKDYLEAVCKIKNYIAEGDCYQVNLSQKFTSPVKASAHEIYQRLRQVSPSPYAAFLNLGDAQILSASPECFLEVNDRQVITRPIKGTRPRGHDTREDARLKEELARSAKDRAELLMITDLERNDLGRVCQPGSIRVTDLGKIETYPQVHHLVSTIEGELEKGRTVVDLLQATFPGGSITGAPKVRAMQIIRELEPHAREIYCGAIGYIGVDGKAQFNVAIRTMVIKDKTAHFWGGGGIVADSIPEKEYEETLTKVKGIREALSI